MKSYCTRTKENEREGRRKGVIEGEGESNSFVKIMTDEKDKSDDRDNERERGVFLNECLPVIENHGVAEAILKSRQKQHFRIK